MKIPVAFAITIAVTTLPALSGCTAVVVGAAAAGGYITHEKGYRVRNPVTKAESTSESASPK